MDFQAWIYSNIEVNPHKIDNQGFLSFGVKLFEMPHTIKGNGSSDGGGVFYLDFKLFEEWEEEICISSKQVSKLGSIENALKMRIAEFFVASLEYERKKSILCDFNRYFAGGLSFFESVRGKSPQTMSAKELILNLNEKFDDSDKSIKIKRQKIVKHAIRDLKGSIEAYSRLLQKRMEKKLEALNE